MKVLSIKFRNGFAKFMISIVLFKKFLRLTLQFIASFEASNIAIGILGQVWYLIVSIPDLCTLTYFNMANCSSKTSEL